MAKKTFVVRPGTWSVFVEPVAVVQKFLSLVRSVKRFQDVLLSAAPPRQ